MPQMIHSVSKEEIMAHLDGQLEAGRAVEVAQHLGTCEECQHQLSEFQNLSRFLASWEIEAGTGEAPSLPVERATPKIRFWKRPWLVIGVPLVVIVVIGLLQNRRQFKAVSRDPIAVYDKTSLDSQSETAEPKRFMATRSRQLQSHSMWLATPQTAPIRNSTPTQAPLIVRTAQISLISNNFEHIRSEVDRICKAHQGYVGLLQLNTTPGQSRSLNATLHIASSQLDPALNEMRQLGQMTAESQGGEDVTQRSVDLDARLANLRTTEQRLQQILKTGTGRLSDVLEVEEAVDRTRGEIETATAEQKLLANQVELATVELSVSEEYKEHLGSTPDSFLNRLHNAAVEGYRNGIDTVIGGLVLLLSIGPTTLIFVAIGLYPAFLLWRKVSRRART